MKSDRYILAPRRTPRTQRIAKGLFLCILGVLGGSNRKVSQPPAIDFDTEIVPVLSRMGCNAGACHGAAVGRGGFRLSLFGSDPAGDFESIVHELEGRRVNLVRPADSLLLLKPTTQLDHGGGHRFGIDDEAAERLRSWIAQGAKRSTNRRQLTKFDVLPAAHRFDNIGAVVPLVAKAQFSDGHAEIVTDWTIWQSGDPSAVEIVDGMAKVHRSGQHVIVARFLDRIVPVRLTLPFAKTTVDLSKERRGNVIDDHILDTLQTLNVPVASLGDDATFLRRLRLDLTGRLPALAEVRSFVADISTDKRTRLIDDLLSSNDFVEFWTFRLALLLRNRVLPNERAGAVALQDWLQQQLNNKCGMDSIVRELLMARGDSHRTGPAWFWRLTNDPRSQAEVIGHAFLGVRLQCANCHNHPLDRWTQDDYHGLAAIFGRVERGRTVSVAQRGEVTHPRTGEPARPIFPGVVVPIDAPDLREPFTSWLTTADNPYFARAIVNRLWAAMFGRGLVEPVDDMRDTNPATHPELLQHLAADFVKHGFDLRHTLRLIANSTSYQRSATTVPGNRTDDRFYSHAWIRTLPAEVLADAWSDVTGVWDQYGNEPLGTRAIQLVDPATPSRTLDLLGRCPRKEACDGMVGNNGLPAMLHRINGEAVNRKLQAPNGRLQRLIAAGMSDQAIIDEFYLLALSRLPMAEERKLMERPAEVQRETWLQDILWALLNCREFTTNH